MESTEVGGDLVAYLEDLTDRSDRLLAAASDGVQEGREWCAELALQGEGLHVTVETAYVQGGRRDHMRSW